MQERQEMQNSSAGWVVFGPPEHLCDSKAESPEQLDNAIIERRLLDAGLQAIHDAKNARLVSTSLLPKRLPQLARLPYAAVCMEARHAGGDFFDFFDRCSGSFGLVIGDVCGTGTASALVRAAVLASLRTLCWVGVDDFERTIAVLNRLLFDSTPQAMYSTLFLADCDEE